MKKRIIILSISIVLICGLAIATKWSDYADMGSGTINDVDTFMVRDVSDTTTEPGSGPTGTQKEYPWSVMKTDLTSWFATITPTFVGVSVSPSATPGWEFKDSDDAAGTASIMANSSGGDNDIILSMGVEIAGSENTSFMELDGVSETIDLLKPVVTTSTLEVNGTITLSNDETIANGDDTEIAFAGTEALALDLDTGTANQVAWANRTTSSTGITDMSFSAFNLVTTGTISGRIPIVSDADGRNITLAEASGTYHLATGAGTWNLPDVDDANGTGWALCIESTGANAVVVNPDDEDTITDVDGVAESAGEALTSSSTAGDILCLIVTSVSSNVANWKRIGGYGTWNPAD